MLAYLAQVSNAFKLSISGTFAAQLLPILTSAVVNRTGCIVTAAALTIMTKVIEQNHASFQYVLPLPAFFDSLFPILRDIPKDMKAMACFSTALTFCSTAFTQLAHSSEFQKHIPSTRHLTDFNDFVASAVLIEQIIDALLNLGEQMPQETLDVIAYVLITVSPFGLLPLDYLLLDSCVEKISYLLPVHVPSLLNSILAIPSENVIPVIPQLLGLFAIQGCAAMICDFILDQMGQSPGDIPELIENLCEAGLIPALCGVISDNGAQSPASSYLLLTHVVLNYASVDPILTEHCSEILAVIINNDNLTESGLIIAGHFARLSSEFVSTLVQSGALNFAMNALESDFTVLRARACSLIGNIAKQAELPKDYTQSVMPLLINQLRSDDLECKKFAAYAIGNILYRTEGMGSFLSKELKPVLDLLNSKDIKAIEYGAYLSANFIRKNDAHTDLVVKEGILDKLADLMTNSDKTSLVIQPISAFCTCGKGLEALRSRNLRGSIQKLTDSKSEIVKTTASTIMRFFEP